MCSLPNCSWKPSVSKNLLQDAYEPVKEALSYYTDQGWIIHIFPWVVGIQGMIDTRHVESFLKFLGIQRKHWHVAVERSVLASV
jgi:hypothetical protein